MARPRLDEQERRAQTVGVRVTAAEAAELRERAQAARLSMGAYLRRRALGQRVRMAAELRPQPIDPSVRVIPVLSGQQQFLPLRLTFSNIAIASVRPDDLQNAELKVLRVV